MQIPDRETAQRIQKFLGTRFREDSKFDDRFPDDFDAYLFLYGSYIDEEYYRAIFDTVISIGDSHILHIAKEGIGGVAPDSMDRLVSVSEADALWNHLEWGLEFYLASTRFEWLVWAFHEPCLHIGGSGLFIEAFKHAYPDWVEMYSPWYEEGGIPVCPGCGLWWAPGLGDWREKGWQCPACREGKPPLFDPSILSAD